jgi:hypothetical protein
MKKEFHPRRKHVVMLTGTRAIETHSFIYKQNKEFSSEDAEISLLLLLAIRAVAVGKNENKRC